ncbi:flagellar biosynthetic protein FliR [Paludibaculum fermentans]|uniref:Flagellar biosynthetic protein FliR n=1 Tax=Paludibaculum fermentans TaxID=1473598 RepID=A0A7S7SKM6_PALFE|nr:flagellar biosynthetic protein FliR [Paludibaculum fermentans]QOY87591.1 flagellar biosynthetic protein FliR [Paludibaculum fermentans]
MPVEFHFEISTALGFLLVVARLGSALLFVPIPGIKAAPELTRVFLICAMCVSLFPLWPRYSAADFSLGIFVLWLVGEMLFGLATGLLVAFLSDMLVFTIQAVSVQAGFSYASSIDPNSEADSSVLQIVAQLMSNLLFFSAGGDRLVLQAFANSLRVWPPGHVELGWPAARVVAGAGAMMMELGLRLALPIAALLLLTDITLALLGRIQAQLQLLSLAFPVKMLGSLAALAALTSLAPLLFQAGLERVQAMVGALVR